MLLACCIDIVFEANDGIPAGFPDSIVLMPPPDGERLFRRNTLTSAPAFMHLSLDLVVASTKTVKGKKLASHEDTTRRNTTTQGELSHA